MPSQHKENAFISPSGFYKESLCSSVLSSTTAITDANGSLTQHVLYFAYGEQFVDEHRNSTNSPYLFNGKEYDEETGRYYYGARYYDPRISLWIGVDPLAGDTPSLTPYRYGFNNPIRFIDPTGMNEETYGIDGDGRINKIDDKKHFDNNGKEVDMLLKGKTMRRYEKDGVIKGKGQIQVENGALAKIENDGINEDSQVFRVNSGESAEKLYDFIAYSTNNEVGKYDITTGEGHNKSIFHTTFNWDKIANNTSYIEGELAKDPALQLKSVMHNHGNNPNPNAHMVGSYGPSGEVGGLTGDIPQAERLTSTFTHQPSPPKFFIWRFGKRTEYNGKGIVKF